MNLTQIWTRVAFDVYAVQITEENIRMVSVWCSGAISETLRDDDPQLYILFEATHYDQKRDSRAYVGDWITLVDGGFKKYKDSSFHKEFEPRKIKTKKDNHDAIRKIVEEAMGYDTWAVTQGDNVITSEGLAREIVEFLERD